MPKPEDVQYLIVHISAAPWGSAESIRAFHKAAPPLGRGWADIGYAYVIRNCFPTYESWLKKRPDPNSDGMIEPGRDLDHDGDVDEEVGAHAAGFNSKSIGLCLIGENGAFTAPQLRAARSLCQRLMAQYHVLPDHVIGHYETGNTTKPCPQIDMDYFRRDLL